MFLNGVYKEFFNHTGRYSLLWGGAGSGKSHAAAQKCIMRCIKNANFRVLVIRKVKATLFLSVFQLLIDILKNEPIFPKIKIVKHPLNIRFPNGSVIHFWGLDEPEKLKSIAEINLIWIEEATEIHLHDFLQINLRLRGLSEYYKNIILTFNPISSQNWIYEYFFTKITDETKKETYAIRTTFRDNVFIDDDYKKYLNDLSLQDENFNAIYNLGEWGAVTDLVFKPFFTESWKPTANDFCIYGIDFGSVSPTAIVQIQFIENRIYIRELLYKPNLDTNDLIAFLKENIDKKAYIYADSARPDLINEIMNNGYTNIYAAAKQANSVKYGIDYIKTLQRNIRICPESKNLLSELNSYKWRKYNNIILDEVVRNSNDHLIDAMRYALYTDYTFFQNDKKRK